MATTIENPAGPALKPTDFASDQDVRWCPGCGDYAILAQAKKALAVAGVEPDRITWISGIGCSSRFPYYVKTYGIHGIHGRALAIATGLKIARPDITVWVATGDGDGLSIGGNHFMHTIRRNSDIKILLFNNRIYGLTKGQVSPTSELGKRTVSTPHGSVDPPIHPVSAALGCGATFVARTVDMNVKHLGEILERAGAHRGAAFVEVYQNCNIFNDGAFKYASDKAERDEHSLVLEQGKPMLFGADRRKGIRMTPNMQPEIVVLGENGITEADILVHDERAANPGIAFMLSQMHYPEFPEPIGVFRAVEEPTYGEQIEAQLVEIQAKKGVGNLAELLAGGDAWEVH